MPKLKILFDAYDKAKANIIKKKMFGKKKYTFSVGKNTYEVDTKKIARIKVGDESCIFFEKSDLVTVIETIDNISDLKQKSGATIPQIINTVKIYGTKTSK